MRTQCPHCQHRFDVPHRAVIAEATRLMERERDRWKAKPSPSSAPADPSARVIEPFEVDGNAAEPVAAAKIKT